MKKRIVILDRDPARCATTAAVLSQNADLEIMGEVFATELNEHFIAGLMKSDLLLWNTNEDQLLDTSFLRQITIHTPHIKIIIMHQEIGFKFAMQAIYAGCNGLLNQFCDVDELYFALNQVYAGRPYFDSKLTLFLFDKMQAFEIHIDALKTDTSLSEKEKDVLDLILNGFTNKEIAYRLFTTKSNVENLRKTLLLKTGAKDNVSLILYKLHELLFGNNEALTN